MKLSEMLKAPEELEAMNDEQLRAYFKPLIEQEPPIKNTSLLVEDENDTPIKTRKKKLKASAEELNVEQMLKDF